MLASACVFKTNLLPRRHFADVICRGGGRLTGIATIRGLQSLMPKRFRGSIHIGSRYSFRFLDV